MLHRDELAVARRAETEALLGAWPMPDGLEHRLPRDDELHRRADLPRNARGENRVAPGPELAAEAGAEEVRDNPHVLLRHAEHLVEHLAMVHYGLRRLVQRDAVPLPRRDRRVQLDWVMHFGRRDVRLVDLHRCRLERALGVPALTICL